jgi:hypothetical protein
VLRVDHESQGGSLCANSPGMRALGLVRCITSATVESAVFGDRSIVCNIPNILLTTTGKIYENIF